MAKSPYRIQFRFSQQEKDVFDDFKRVRAGRQLAAAIVEDFAVAYADKAYKEIVTNIEQQINLDLRMELAHMAMLFRRHITGAAARGGKPAGSLSTKLPPSDLFPEESVAISSSINPWEKRTPKYLREKQRSKGHTRWFEYSGYMRRASTAETWEKAFGPIRVTFRRSNTAETRGRIGFGADSTKVHTRVGIMRVYTLSNITPAMLPALATGDPKTKSTADGRRTGLIGLMAGVDDDLAYRLGGRWTTPYRPTLEPFLSFYLTRSVPNAVALRLEKGVLGAIRSGQSGGRTR